MLTISKSTTFALLPKTVTRTWEYPEGAVHSKFPNSYEFPAFKLEPGVSILNAFPHGVIVYYPNGTRHVFGSGERLENKTSDPIIFLSGDPQETAPKPLKEKKASK